MIRVLLIQAFTFTLVCCAGWSSAASETCVASLVPHPEKDPSEILFYLGKSREQVAADLVELGRIPLRRSSDRNLVLFKGAVLPTTLTSSDDRFRVTFPLGLQADVTVETGFWRWVFANQYIVQLNPVSVDTFVQPTRERVSRDLGAREVYDQAIRQLSQSSTYQEADEDLRPLFHSEQAAAFRMLISRADSALTVDDLRWFKQIILSEESRRSAYNDSTFSGDSPFTSTRQELYEQSEGGVSPDVRQPGTGVMLVRSWRVRRLLTEWLQDVNAVTSETDFLTIVELYQRYQLIHPFPDGEGRTARALLDFMLWKAGLSMVNHNLETSHIVFVSLDRLAERIYRASE